MWVPGLVRCEDRLDAPVVRLGHELVDDYLEFVAARARVTLGTPTPHRAGDANSLSFAGKSSTSTDLTRKSPALIGRRPITRPSQGTASLSHIPRSLSR